MIIFTEILEGIKSGHRVFPFWSSGQVAPPLDAETLLLLRTLPRENGEDR